MRCPYGTVQQFNEMYTSFIFQKIRSIRVSLIFIILLISSNLQAQSPQELDSMLDEINADSLLQTVLDLQNFGSRFALREGGNCEVAEYIAERLNQYGVTAAVDSFYETGTNWLCGDYSQWFYNVRGVLPADHPVDDSIVIIGAHLDAIALNPEHSMVMQQVPGADDNASGVAVFLEIARVFHLHNYVPRRDIHFMAYDGEELGLFGAVHDAWRRQDEQDKIVVMLNNDMVSFQPDDDWKLTLHWYDNALDLVAKAADVCGQYTDIQPIIPTEAENGNARSSDSYAYYNYGFRPVFAIEYNFSTSYHTVFDVADSNNYAYHSHVTRYNLAMLCEFAGSNVETSIVESSPKSMCIYPNPVQNVAMLRLTLEQPERFSISVFDFAGRCVQQWPSRDCVAGTNYLEMDFSALPAGVYFCHIVSAKQHFVQKVVVHSSVKRENG